MLKETKKPWQPGRWIGVLLLSVLYAAISLNCSNSTGTENTTQEQGRDGGVVRDTRPPRDNNQPKPDKAPVDTAKPKTPCGTKLDCKDPDLPRCVDGFCAPECETSTDCLNPTTPYCVGGRCQEDPPPSDGPTGETNDETSGETNDENTTTESNDETPTQNEVPPGETVTSPEDGGTTEPSNPGDRVIPDGPSGPVTFKIVRLIVRTGPNDGFDLDGDGKKDNQLGTIFNANSIQISIAARYFRDTVDNDIQNENLILLLTLSDVTDPTGQGGTATVNLSMGDKGANPGEYSINKSKSFDPSTQKPYFEQKLVPIKNGVIETSAAAFPLFINFIKGQPAQRVDLRLTKLQFKIEPGFTKLSSGILTGAVPARTLDVNAGLGSVLEILVQEAPTEAQPDMDLDKDNKEKLARRNNKLICTDGDGKDVQPPATCPNGGSSCSCIHNPKMADGYSTVFYFEASPTKLIP